MPLYKLQTDKIISQIKPASRANERELQRLFEANLPQLLGVHFSQVNSSPLTGNEDVLILYR